jgi:fatty acid desaturase
MHASRDPRLASVPWRDLLPLSRSEVVRELLLPLPWLAGSLAFASLGLVPLALVASFYFFLLGLRLVHDVFHRSLGLSRVGNDALLFALSLLMLGSMHAVRANHLRHHAHCLEPDDVEGSSARGGAVAALLRGPAFPLRMHAAALRRAHADERHWIGLELLGSAAVVGLAFGVPTWDAARYHVLAMAAGQCLTAFFAVWTVHRGSIPGSVVTRTLRSPLRSALAGGMFFHAEHHLYPAVPTRRLPALARRLDAVAADLTVYQVL